MKAFPILILGVLLLSAGCFGADPSDEGCGDGEIQSGETCDGDCPTSCDDANPCTEDSLQGAAATCDVVCVNAAITVCDTAASDGCCPNGCNSRSDSDCSAVCGDGVIDAGELCDGNCPVDCNDGNACTTDLLSGGPTTCDATCSHDAVTACASGDGCCPAGCTVAVDSDCSAFCGNGVVDSGETCDGNCPTACDDLNACTTDALTGSASTCSASCASTPVVSCTHGDGCCPAGCTTASDDDCSPSCGNGVVDGGETCDGDCPTACDDGQACTTDTLTGSASTCTAACVSTAITACTGGDGCCPAGCNAGVDGDCPPACGNGYLDTNETCDGNCPTTCDDGQVCTADTLTGSAATCSALCTSTPIGTCAGGDGCCPSGCNAGSDGDCPAVCGNGYVDGNETCDGNCPASCDDGQACTTDTASGSAFNCDLACTSVAVSACASGDGCCPAGCDFGSDSDCPVGPCTSIADLRLAADGPVNLGLCPALVTYVSELSYTLQAAPTGPAIMVYEGFGWIPDVAVGDEVTLRVTELGTYHGLREIIFHDPPQLLSQGNAVSPLIQDLSAGTVPSEALESELVRVNGVTVTAVDNLNLTVGYGAASGVTYRVSGTTTYGYCVGATFDFVGLSSEYDGYRLQSHLDSDVSAFDSSACPYLGRAPVVGDLVLNEVLADPPATLLGDANCDGFRDTSEDEFVEIVNVSAQALDLTGVTISDGAALRYTFLAVSLPPGGVIVVFGGGIPACSGWGSNVQVEAASSLGLNNAGDTITIRDSTGATLVSLTYPDVGVPAGSFDTSLTLSPDLNTGGGYILHNTAASGLSFSPGLRIDGTPFP